MHSSPNPKPVSQQPQSCLTTTQRQFKLSKRPHYAPNARHQMWVSSEPQLSLGIECTVSKNRKWHYEIRSPNYKAHFQVDLPCSHLPSDSLEHHAWETVFCRHQRSCIYRHNSFWGERSTYETQQSVIVSHFGEWSSLRNAHDIHRTSIHHLPLGGVRLRFN